MVSVADHMESHPFKTQQMMKNIEIASNNQELGFNAWTLLLMLSLTHIDV